MSLKRKNQLIEAKKEIDNLSGIIQKVINEEVTQSEAAKSLGITPKQWNSECNNMLLYRLHKIKYLLFFKEIFIFFRLLKLILKYFLDEIIFLADFGPIPGIFNNS